MDNSLNSNRKGSVLSFGELLLRICPDADSDWLNDNKLSFYVGGAELNVATALALWGVPSKYFTALPDNGLSKQIISYLQEKDIDTSSIYHNGDRLGLYYLTKGKDLKHDAVIYDRANSAFALLKPGMIDWDEVLKGVSWFHFSAICPAISQNVADVCKDALEAASAKGIKISVDLNYRAKLWQYGKSPQEIIPQLMPYCDMIMGNIWAAETMLGIPVMPDIHALGQKDTYHQAALHTSRQIIKQYPRCKTVANTFRFDEGLGIKYYTTLYQQDTFVTSNEYSSAQIIDKVGSGDCFMAGLIYGFYKNWRLKETLEYATAAAFEKLFIESDATNKTAEDIIKSIKNEQ
jgi:2-dehydro-3-deoxygluconokinase